jgi:hypothetical protein
MTEPLCPRCGEPETGGLIEYDGALRRWTCAVCNAAWVDSRWTGDQPRAVATDGPSGERGPNSV